MLIDFAATMPYQIRVISEFIYEKILIKMFNQLFATFFTIFRQAFQRDIDFMSVSCDNTCFATENMMEIQKIQSVSCCTAIFLSAPESLSRPY